MFEDKTLVCKDCGKEFEMCIRDRVSTVPNKSSPASAFSRAPGTLDRKSVV